MLHNPKHESARREVLEALDSQISKLKETIRTTDALIVGLDERTRQLDELHSLHHARLDLLNDGESADKPYRLQQPSSTWGIP